MDENEDGFEYLLSGKLKTVSQKEIEKAIAKAVSELVDEDFSCSINTIRYKGLSAEIDMTLNYNSKWLADK
jgi:transcriptional/translational regulatory protein YebC/TACO1